MMSNIDKKNEKYDAIRKMKEYEMKIIKMSGYLSDYYIDRAIESDDYYTISSILINYFSGTLGKTVDVGYLVSKYNEFGLNERAEDMDFDIDEWYKIKFEVDKPSILTVDDITKDMSDDEYVEYMIEKRKNDSI